MIALLALVITITVPSPSDAAYIAALACGEACGMPQAAQEVIIANLLYDYSEHGREWLRARWYAPLKPNARVKALVWNVLARMRRGERWARYKLIGSARDAIFWREHGYVDSEPDARWAQGNMQVNAFGLSWPKVVFAPVECVGERCPQ